MWKCECIAVTKVAQWCGISSRTERSWPLVGIYCFFSHLPKSCITFPMSLPCMSVCAKAPNRKPPAETTCRQNFKYNLSIISNVGCQGDLDNLQAYPFLGFPLCNNFSKNIACSLKKDSIIQYSRNLA